MLSQASVSLCFQSMLHWTANLEDMTGIWSLKKKKKKRTNINSSVQQLRVIMSVLPAGQVERRYLLSLV